MYYNKVEICGVNTAKLATLTSEEKHDLLVKAKTGDQAARQKLIDGNLRLVLSIIQRFTNRRENLDDLFPDGLRKGIFSICLCLSGCTVRDHSALTQPDVRLSELVILMPEGSNDKDRWTDVRCGKYTYHEYR